jgi:hypothetical protein
MNARQREKRIVALFDLYEAFHTAAEKLLRDDPEMPLTVANDLRFAMHNAHQVMRLARSAAEDASEPDTLPAMRHIT